MQTASNFDFCDHDLYVASSPKCLLVLIGNLKLNVVHSTLGAPVLEYEAAAGIPPSTKDLAADQSERSDRHLRDQ